MMNFFYHVLKRFVIIFPRFKRLNSFQNPFSKVYTFMVFAATAVRCADRPSYPCSRSKQFVYDA